MAFHYTVKEIARPTEEDHAVIFNGINHYAKAVGFNAAGGAYFFAAYAEDQSIIAAISGFDNFGYAEIGGLWVQESMRGRGIGAALLDKVACWAKGKRCCGLTVFTLKEWPAFDWYEKQGFQVEYERPGHANNSIGCYLIRTI